MRHVAAAALVLILGGCGFHFAGSRPLPEELKSVYIDVVTPYRVSEPPVEASLRGLLLRRGGQVRGKSADAETVVRLSDLSETRSVLSIGPDGKALEYLLVTSVRYQVNRGNQLLAGPDTLSASREYSFNAQQVLAKEAEESRLRDFIQNELAELLLLRIEAQLTHPAPALSPADAPAATPGAAPPG